MRRPIAVTVLVLALASSTACGESGAPTATRAWPPIVPGAPSPPIVPGTSGIMIGNLGYLRREIPLGGRLLIQPPIHVGYDEDWGPFASNISDASVIGWTSLERGEVLVEGRSAGSTLLTLTGARMQTVLPIAVLDTVPAPNPVVVDEFYLIELLQGNRIVYAPQLVLRDSSRAGGSALIAAWFEMPRQERTSRCAMVREIYAASTPVFRDFWGSFELTFAPGSGRLTADQPVIAHLTLRVPGPKAVELTVAASRVVPGSAPEVREFNDDLMSCGP